MHIYGPAHLHGPQPIGPPHGSRVSRPDAQTDSKPISDELEISDAARLAEQAGEVPEVRQDRVDAIRAKIAEGTYETQEKLEIAVERLLDEIG
ncbi:MAG: flagellar biosynthesis anti-sigma factor FlgM [Planctomycetota bacterium]|jgi:negative regulator of flagellin synthesis FlgM